MPVILALGAMVVSAEELKRILILGSFGQYVAPYGSLAATFRITLAKELGQPVEFFDVPLDMMYSGEAEKEDLFLDFLEDRLKAQPMNLAVAVGAPAARFAVKHRERLFPDTPVLLAGTDPRVVPPEFFRTNATMVAQRADGPGMVEDILQMQPETTNILVVFGSSPVEKFWAGEFRREFEPFTNRVGFTWLDDLALEQVKERCANAPPRSFILYGLFLMDAAGVPYENSEPLKQLHHVARAPIFGYFESELGLGSVGGRLYRDAEIGAQSARVAIRILQGERPETIPPAVLSASRHQYDWRELRRWNIRESRLPADGVIRFRPPGFLELYWGRTLFALIFISLQTVFTAGLFVARNRQRRAEAAAHDLSRRLITAHEEERSRLARELHDDVTQRLARLAIDAARAEDLAMDDSGREKLRSVRDGLVRLSEDVHALSYRLHPSVLEDLGLTEALQAECDRFQRNENVAVDLRLDGIPEGVPGDMALCLFRVAQGALRNVARHARAGRVNVVVRALDGGLQLAVRDDGVGFDRAVQQERRTLGLASMQERVQLLGGEIDIESEPGRGTTVVAWVPLRKEPS